MKGFSYKLIASDGGAKAGELVTPHGRILTPIFMPVGTQASVKSLDPTELVNLGAQIILGNTYHLHLRPGEKKVDFAGKLHGFMRWDGPILTDSGGYQVSSLGLFRDGSEATTGKLKKTVVTEEGVKFWSHLDGSEKFLSPEKSIEIQEDLGADIIMAFDEATPAMGKKYARQAMNRTHKWLDRSIIKWRELEEKKSETDVKPQAMFGIIQGGNYKDLRRASAEFVVNKKLPGVAIGGGSIGQDAEETEKNVAWIRDLLPSDRPVYLMGVGVEPGDVLAAIQTGADMFDCVAPTRLARMGGLYSGQVTGMGRGVSRLRFESEFRRARLVISHKRFEGDKSVIDDKCDCYTCTGGFSRMYLRHLFVAKELLYYKLASIHNLRMMIRTAEIARREVVKD